MTLIPVESGGEMAEFTKILLTQYNQIQSVATIVGYRRFGYPSLVKMNCMVMLKSIWRNLWPTTRNGMSGLRKEKRILAESADLFGSSDHWLRDQNISS
jgi:hypothetical protein